MPEIQSYTINTSEQKLPVRNSAKSEVVNESFILEAHTSNNMKVKRPTVNPNDSTPAILNSKTVYSDKEATKRMQAINTDIYESSKQEKEKHEFNFKRYFTIFGIIALLTAIISYFRKGK